MALTPSAMIALGSPAPAFTLPEPLTGLSISLHDGQAYRATVILFICNHCPYVQHINMGIVSLAKAYVPLGVRFIAISSNDAVAYPDDAPEQMAIAAKTIPYPFPYLYDESQAVAKAYEAACTPDCYIYDRALLLAYRGQLDDARPGNGKPNDAEDMRAALDAIIAGVKPNPIQRPSIGCNIKWKKG
jgi:peroxiredoxin